MSSNQLIGPALPPHLLRKDADEDVKDKVDSDFKIQTPKNEDIIGPKLPPNLKMQIEEVQVKENAHVEEEDDDDEVYGPMPLGVSGSSTRHIALEERALELKINQLNDTKNIPIEREEWMLELPEVKLNLGTGARQFRSKAGPDMSDRSSWTDIPNKSEKQQVHVNEDLRKIAEVKNLKKRDEEQEKMSKKCKKRKSDSLMEIHQQKLKNSKVEKTNERRPFSRELDLQVDRFDEQQRKLVLKKAELLDDRFSSGASKFL